MRPTSWLWDAAPASERVLELDRLDAQRLAVLLSRGANNEYSAYGGVPEFDVSPGSTGEIGWSALIEGVVLREEPGFFEESAVLELGAVPSSYSLIFDGKDEHLPGQHHVWS